MYLENRVGNYLLFLAALFCFGLGRSPGSDDSSGTGGEPGMVRVVGAGSARVVGAGLVRVVGAGSARVVGAGLARVVGAGSASCSVGSMGLVGRMTSSKPKAHNISG